MPQHAFQPVLAGRGDIDGQLGLAVQHGQGGSGQEVISHPDYDLSKQTRISPPSTDQQDQSLWWISYEINLQSAQSFLELCVQ